MLSREGMSTYRGRIAIVPLYPFSSEESSVTSAMSDAEAGLPLDSRGSNLQRFMSIAQVAGEWSPWS
jgi:hypothetical protein